MADVVIRLEFDEEVEYRHRPTVPLDENGQGDCHTAFAFVGHRAVVDVDIELGLVRLLKSRRSKTSVRAQPAVCHRTNRRRDRAGPRFGADGRNHSA